MVRLTKSPLLCHSGEFGLDKKMWELGNSTAVILIDTEDQQIISHLPACGAVSTKIGHKKLHKYVLLKPP